MAPSGSSIFSKLRPGHARRNASTLASPEPVPGPAAYPLPSPASHNTDYFLSPRLNDNASHASASPISPFPPQLPPITRVASKLETSASPNRSPYTASQHSPSTGGGSSGSKPQHHGMLSPPQRAQDPLSPTQEHKLLSVPSFSGAMPAPGQAMSQSETPSHSVISPSYSTFSKSQTSLLSGISDKLTGNSRTSTPTGMPTKSKSRMSLRNPMTLLMRRRSGQTLDPLADESLVTQRSPSNVPPMPDDYDPRIRGKIVHDFNAPRLNRAYSSNATEGGEVQQEINRASPPKMDKEHTPVFHEHFDDDTSYEQSQAAIRAEQLMPTPVDMHGNRIGYAMSEQMIQQLQMSPMPVQFDGQSAANMQTHGLGLAGVDERSNSSPTKATDAPANTMAPNNQRSLSNIDLDDDMYFDDGLIGDQDEIDAAEFDESVFDDPNGPLYERKVKFAEGESAPAVQARPYDLVNSETGYDADDDTVSKGVDKSHPSLAHKTSVAQQNSVPSFDNLAAYHSALADAATRAQAEGRFSRKASVDAGHVSSDADELPSLSNSRPSLVPDDGRFSVDTISFPMDNDVYGMDSSFVDDYEYSDFDSALEDDPIIAAANAEALAYDDEGFYGQEFGFYASAAGESPSAWGGVFGPSGIGRTVSGRNAVREPNLTPITERSEYSTRNSFISLNQFRDGQQPITSPGLAHLARLSPYGFPGTDEEELSLDALLRLRKGAFGGSANSLPGSVSNKGEDRPESPTLTSSDYNSMSSPMNYTVGNEAPLLPPISELYAQHNLSLAMSPTGMPISSPSTVSLPISPFPMPLPSPYLAQHHNRPPNPPSIDTSLSSPSAPTVSTSAGGPRRPSMGLSPISNSSPITPNGSGGGWNRGHSRKGSAADSVTYVREHDEAGEGRWVLERRRTAESGELELIGRQIVEGGRI
ncbi:hypothetical protein Ptr902_11800 [Pyrenophora tritici-repentis]|nr:hypothetical protein Ptr902_11800 [Pyrenophora tritici-repentis]